MPEVLEQLQFPIGALREDRGAEWLHNLLDSNILVGKLVPGGAVGRAKSISTHVEVGPKVEPGGGRRVGERTYQTRPKAPMPTGWRSEYLVAGQGMDAARVGGSDGLCLPRRDLKRGAKDLGAHEFGHGCGAVGMAWTRVHEGGRNDEVI